MRGYRLNNNFMNQIQIKDINLGGIADSKFQGQKNSVSEMQGFDLHGEPGILRHNQKLTKESGIVIDDLVKKILPCSDGLTYAFGSTNGKIFVRSITGVWTYVATVSPAAGTVGIMDAWEYQGYIYYSMQSRLGRVAVGAPTNWVGRSDSWATFTNTDAEFHPFKEVNAVLYVGDGKYLAQVDAGVFSANALDIAAPLRIKSLGKMLTNIILGTFVNTYRVMTQVLNWNTWSVSFSVADEIPEVGINCFLATDNFNLVSAGRKGNLYLYNGNQMDQFKVIPGDWLGGNTATIHQNATCNMNGMPLFGLSNISGNPTKQGIYSLAGYDRNYPKVLNLEWFISTGSYNFIDIGAIVMSGTDLLASWKDSNTVTMTIADPGVVTWTAHGQANGTPIMFTTTGALPTGITASTYYYIRSTGTNTLNLYDTAAHAITGGATGRVATTGSQSGVHTRANYGIDVLDLTAKVATAYFVTRVINIARNDSKTLSGYVAYRSLPTGTSIKIYHKVNYTSSWTEGTTVVDTIRKTVYLKESFPEANTLEIKVESNANANDAPEIELAEFLFD